MERGFYSETVFVNSNEVDDHYELKISTIFKYLQQVSTNHAELIGLGKKDTVDKGMFWVITRMKVKIYRRPKMLETLTITTHPDELMMFIFPRFYQIYDEQGKLVIAASSTWALLDLVTHKAITKPPVDLEKYPFARSEEDISIPEKITFDSLYKVDERKVRYSDIDLNGHLNNTKYIEYIVDIHDVNFYKKRKINEIVINYEREIIDGDIVTLFSDMNNPEIVLGDVTDKHSFIAKISYIER